MLWVWRRGAATLFAGLRTGEEVLYKDTTGGGLSYSCWSPSSINHFSFIVHHNFLSNSVRVVTGHIKAHQVLLNRVPKQATEDSVWNQILLLRINFRVEITIFTQCDEYNKTMQCEIDEQF